MIDNCLECVIEHLKNVWNNWRSTRPLKKIQVPSSKELGDMKGQKSAFSVFCGIPTTYVVPIDVILPEIVHHFPEPV